MANNYLEFSEVLPNLTAEEEAWLEEQLEPIHVFGDKEYTEAALPEGLDAAKSDWSGFRVYMDMEEPPEFPDNLGFCYEFCNEGPGENWGRHLWFYADEWGCPELVAHLVRKFLQKFRPGDCWSLSYAVTCSKPRVGEFGGGAVFVTTDKVRYFSDGDFLEKARKAFEQSKQPDVPPTTEQRFVLYDFDMGDLASTRVYDDAREAAEDADLLDNVMVAGFTLEHTRVGSPAEKDRDYTLELDGPLFRDQRELLLRLHHAAGQRETVTLGPKEHELLEGLLGLTDAIADQAADRHGIDCLIPVQG